MRFGISEMLWIACGYCDGFSNTQREIKAISQNLDVENVLHLHSRQNSLGLNCFMSPLSSLKCIDRSNFFKLS